MPRFFVLPYTGYWRIYLSRNSLYTDRQTLDRRQFNLDFCISNIVYNSFISLSDFCIKQFVYNTASFHYQIFVLPYWLLADIQYCVQNIVYNTNVYYKHIILTIQLFTVCLDFCITIYWLLADLLK
jgi:hypothetical protein